MVGADRSGRPTGWEWRRLVQRPRRCHDRRWKRRLSALISLARSINARPGGQSSWPAAVAVRPCPVGLLRPVSQHLGAGCFHLSVPESWRGGACAARFPGLNHQHISEVVWPSTAITIRPG